MLGARSRSNLKEISLWRDAGAALLLRLRLIEPELSAVDLCPGGIIQCLLLEVLPRID